jgi:hypothetical protein
MEHRGGISSSLVLPPAQQWLRQPTHLPRGATPRAVTSNGSCPRRKEISPRYWRRYQHATSCTKLCHASCPEIFALQGARRLLNGPLERSVDLDLHRIWERGTMPALMVGVGSGTRARFQPRLLPFPPTLVKESRSPTHSNPHSDSG